MGRKTTIINKITIASVLWISLMHTSSHADIPITTLEDAQNRPEALCDQWGYKKATHDTADKAMVKATAENLAFQCKIDLKNNPALFNTIYAELLRYSE